VRRRLPWELVALPALVLARLAPAYGVGLGLRLATATACLLVPGSLLARAFGRPGAAGALACSLGGLFVASVVMFAAHGTLWLALLLYAALGIAALPYALAAHPRSSPLPGAFGVAALGLVFGVALWRVAGSLGGDALFHLARIRKLEAFHALTLHRVDEFVDGGLHPGYAFPLWHVLLALVSRVAAVDPPRVVLHEATVLVPLAFVVAYEAGAAVFRSAWSALSVVLAQVAIIALAAGHGGSYTALALPATAARQLLVPAVIALFFSYVREPSRGGVAALVAAELGLALVHPTYAVFAGIPLGGYVVARALLARAELREGAAALAALVVPTGVVLIWLLPVVRQTVSHNPSAAERLRGFEKYRDQLTGSPQHFHLSAEVVARTGAVAVAALVLVPVAVLAARRRWAALVLGGTAAVLALTLVPTLFTHFSDAVSLSQSRRLAGFVPFAFAFAGGAAVLGRMLWLGVLPLALAAGIWLELEYPGNFAYAGAGGPAFAAWVGLLGGLGALGLGVVLSRWRALERSGLISTAAALLFVLPVAVHGFERWSARRSTPSPLTPGLVRALDRLVPDGSVVFSDDDTSYWVGAAKAVYVASDPPGHVADTKANRPYRRREDALLFMRTGDLAIPRRYRAGWILVDRARFHPELGLLPVYADRRYALYRLRPNARWGLPRRPFVRHA
jgi:hypothetical protein